MSGSVCVCRSVSVIGGKREKSLYDREKNESVVQRRYEKKRERVRRKERTSERIVREREIERTEREG